MRPIITAIAMMRIMCRERKALRPAPCGNAAGAAVAISASTSARALPRSGQRIVRELGGRRVDEPVADLGELAADLSLHRVGERGLSAIGGRQRNAGRAIGKSRRSTLPLELERVTRRRRDVGKVELAGKARRDGSHLRGDSGSVRVLARPLESLAAGDARFQHLRIDERFPHPLGGGGYDAGLGDLHARAVLVKGTCYRTARQRRVDASPSGHRAAPRRPVRARRGCAPAGSRRHAAA